MTARKWAEIVNPSDECHICIDDEAAAVVATLIVGQGRLGLTRDEGQILPLFIFDSGEEVESWFEERYGHALRDVSNERIVAAAKTAQYGSVEEIESLTAALDGLPDAAERMKTWEDRKRTSLNRIVDAFHELQLKPREEVTP